MGRNGDSMLGLNQRSRLSIKEIIALLPDISTAICRFIDICQPNLTKRIHDRSIHLSHGNFHAIWKMLAHISASIFTSK